MERVLRLFQRSILAEYMPAYYMYAGGKRRPRTRVILSAWKRGLVVHLRCKVKGISSLIPNYFGAVPWYSVLVPFFSATGARQTSQMAVTLHRATEIKNHAIAHTFIIRLMKTGIKAKNTGLSATIYKVSHSSKLYRVQRNIARCLFRDLKRFRGPKPYRNDLARVGQGNSPKSSFPKDACGAWYD